MGKKLTIVKFIEDCQKIHNNFYDYSAVEIVNSREKVKIKCPVHGYFYQSPSKHKNGQGCPICGRLKTISKQQFSQIEIIKNFKKIHKDNYDYTNVQYRGYHRKVEIICRLHGSFFQTPASHIKNKSGCPKCGRERTSKKRKISPEEFFKRSNIVHHNKYDYSKSNFVDLSTEVLIYCIIHSNFFKQKPLTHIRGNTNCEYCVKDKLIKYYENKRVSTSEIVKRFKKQHKNKYDYSLIQNPIKCEDKINIVCPNHGKFTQRVSNHIRGDGCPTCAGNEALTIEDMKALAEKRNGTCLSSTYKNLRTKLKWRCADGHVWEASPDQIRHNNSWCPTCSYNLGEEIVRIYFETIFLKPFPRKRPKWLKGLELDGYSSDLGLAFEHHGQQHYKQKKIYHKTTKEFEDQISRDNRKRELCVKHKVTLFEIPEVPTLTPINELPQLLNSAFKKINIRPEVSPLEVNIDAVHVFSNHSKMKELKKIAKRRGGTLTSKSYLGMNIHLTWRCEIGHEWKAIPSSIISGSWCPICAGKIIISIEELRKVAKQKGGKCLSRKYINANSKLRWQCAEGHKWEAIPYAVRNLGTWCPYCVGKHKTIDDAHRIALKNNGACLSNNYVNIKSKLSWRCAKGHNWSASLGSIIGGTWCPVCAGTKKLTIEDMHSLASKYEGECLSASYTNSNSHLHWRCSKGHDWNARPSNISKGHWCPYCAQNKKLTIKDMQLLAKSFGGICLSSKYVNMHSKLRWRCEKDHEWEAEPNALRGGHWCPMCAGNKKLTIEDMQKLALQHGGVCLSKIYINARTKLKWKCSKGHQWEATPDVVKNRGSWCMECKKNKS